MRFPFFRQGRSSRRRSNKPNPRGKNYAARFLRLEHLEPRQMLSINLGSLPSIQLPGGKTTLVPLTGVDSLGGPITYSFSASDNSLVLANMSPASKSIQLNVTGTDSNNQAFTGTLVLHLFEDLSPIATSRIEQLVGQHYYDGLTFFRVLDGFVAQTGNNGAGDTGQSFSDEFNTSLTFNSPGLLAMANAGDDTNDAEFFITAIDKAGSTDPVQLADMPEFLNFNYTIFGQLVSGFDTFEKIMSTTVTTNGGNPPETSLPTNSITITSASVITDTQDAVLSVFAPTTFDGSNATITVTATNANNESTQQTFNVSGLADTNIDPPFLGPTPDLTTPFGTPINIQLTSTDPSNQGVQYGFGGADHVQINIDQNTGAGQLIPEPGFTGPIQIIVGVAPTGAANQQSSFDTQVFTLNVDAGPVLNPVADQSTLINTATSFDLSATNPDNVDLVYSVVDPTTLDAPANVTVSVDQTTGQVTLTPLAGFAGSVDLLARVKGADVFEDPANYSTQEFHLFVAPQLSQVADQETPTGASIHFTLNSTGLSGENVFYTVFDPSNNAPGFFNIDVDHTTGDVTLTPLPGFHNTVTLTAGVRDANAADDPANYSTQQFTFTVDAPPTLDPINNLETGTGAPIGLDLHSVDTAGAGVVYSVVDPNTLGAPANATVVVDQGTGHLTLTPNNGFHGMINLEARVRSTTSPDDPANYTTQNFTLTVDPPPTLDLANNVLTTIGTPVSFDLHSVDPTGQGVVYSFLDLKTFAPPTHVTIDIDNATGHVTFTPDVGYNDTLTLFALVRSAGSADNLSNESFRMFSFTVEPPPLLDTVSNLTTTVGTPVGFNIRAIDSAQAGVFYSVVDPNTLGVPANVTVGIDQATGHVTLTPAAGFSGTVTLQARVRSIPSPDEPINYTTQNFTLSVSAPPALGDVDDQSTRRGTADVFTLTSTNPGGGSVAYTVVDSQTFAAPTNVTVSINQQTGQVTLTPKPGFTGQVSLLAGVRVAASPDVEANYDTQAFTLDVAADPTLGAVSNETTIRGTPVNFTLTSTDVVGSGVFYSVVDAATGQAPTNITVNVNSTTGAVTLTPNPGVTGTFNLLARVRGATAVDDPLNYSTQAFTLTVSAAPTLNTVANQTTTLGVPDLFTLTSTGNPSEGVTYSVVDATTLLAPAHVTVNVNQATGQVTLTPDSGFTGPINLLARVIGNNAVDDPLDYSTSAFTFTVGAGPQLGAVGNQTTPPNTANQFTLTSTDPAGAGVVYSIVDPTSLGAPAHVTVNINQTTGQVTLTPDNGFVGSINLLARVRGNTAVDDPANYSTQAFTLSIDTPPTLNSIGDIQVPGGKSSLVPLTGVDAGGEPITYTATSSDPNVTVSLVSQASKSLQLTVTGTDKDGNAFSGTLVLKLFEDLAPETTARIEQLVNQGYYNNLLFHRILDGFVAQGGQTNGGADTGQKIDDEFNTSLTFNSPGLLAMANAGDDTSDAEFFITAIDNAGANTPITPANMPQFLNFNYTIFGQLVSGFDTFEKLMQTQVASNGGNPPETSSPTHPVTITNAQLITDTQNAVLKVTAPASFNGSNATITVTATNTDGLSAQQTFNAVAVTDTQVDPPFLGSVSNQTTTTNVPVNMTLTSTDLEGAGVHYTVVDPTTFAAPANVTVSINQTTGVVTLTPKAGFTGTINLLAGVRASSATEAQASYDTEAFTLTVNAPSGSLTPPTGLAVDASSNTGPFAGNGYVTTSTPKLTVTAKSGATVQFKLGGTVIATGTETGTGTGVYTASIPAGKLAVGANSITAVVSDNTGTSTDSTALSVIYAPTYAGGVYTVPGAAGSAQQVAIAWTVRKAAYNDEIGYFIVDSADGSINGIAPGSAGYAQAALSSSTRHVIFAKGQKAGANDTISVQGGQMIVFYMIQNNTTAAFLSKNPSDTLKGNNNGNAPLAFFSVQGANPDGKKHSQIIADQTTGNVQYNWEDLAGLGDSDFNDVVMTVRLASQTNKPTATLHAPGTGATSVSITGTLGQGGKSTPKGDVGVFFIDDPDGTIGTLHPGDPGYIAAALDSTNSGVLFHSGAAKGTSNSVDVPAGKYVAFYLITNGTTDDFLTNNPTNASGHAQMLFSFDDSNPDAKNHFRWYSSNQQQTSPDVNELHVMDKVGGGEADFDAYTIDLSFADGST